MKKIITIAREFGAGGGEIGRRVAKELGIEFYDKDIILRTALANSKLDPELVRKWDERVPKSFGFAQSLFDFYNKPLDEELWQAQRDAIREMANHENCVIVGRNSEYILREFDHCLHVFAHASFQWRVKRMAGKMPGVSTFPGGEGRARRRSLPEKELRVLYEADLWGCPELRFNHQYRETGD